MTKRGHFAALKLLEVRTRLGYQSPCQRDPTTWDPPDPARETATDAAERIVTAQIGCSYCEIWDLCEAQAGEEKKFALGVYNGKVYFDRLTPTMNANVMHALERRKKNTA